MHKHRYLCCIFAATIPSAIHLPVSTRRRWQRRSEWSTLVVPLREQEKTTHLSPLPGCASGASMDDTSRPVLLCLSASRQIGRKEGGVSCAVFETANKEITRTSIFLSTENSAGPQPTPSHRYPTSVCVEKSKKKNKR